VIFQQAENKVFFIAASTLRAVFIDVTPLFVAEVELESIGTSGCQEFLFLV
jgi:hypothetical protein